MGMDLLLADMPFRRAVGELIILLPKARMMTALLLGTNISRSCLSSLQIHCNFFFKEKYPPFFWLWINACLLEICARKEVFAILFIVLSLIPWFSALLLISTLVCVPSESGGSVVLLLLDSCSFLKVAVSPALLQATDAPAFTFYHLEIF